MSDFLGISDTPINKLFNRPEFFASKVCSDHCRGEILLKSSSLPVPGHLGREGTGGLIFQISLARLGQIIPKYKYKTNHF